MTTRTPHYAPQLTGPRRFNGARLAQNKSAAQTGPRPSRAPSAQARCLGCGTPVHGGFVTRDLLTFCCWDCAEGRLCDCGEGHA